MESFDVYPLDFITRCCATFEPKNPRSICRIKLMDRKAAIGHLSNSRPCTDKEAERRILWRSTAAQKYEFVETLCQELTGVS